MPPSAISSPDTADHEVASDNVGSALLMSDARTLPWTPYLMSILTVAMLGTAAAVDQQPDFQGRPPLTAEELWTKVLALLNEHDGSVTKERFEQVFDVRFGPPRREEDGTTYLAHAGREWYFNAYVTIFNDQYKSVTGPEANGAHSGWYISWQPGTFGVTCLSAKRVRETLVASGWSSPWQSWGAWEKLRWSAPFPERRRGLGDPPALVPQPPLGPPPPRANFSRNGAEGGHPNALPRGVVDSTGDQPDSCVTGILVEAKP